MKSNRSKIQSKIIIIVIVIFVFFILTSLIFNIYSLEAKGRKEIEEYRKTEMERTEEDLKSFVYLAYTVVKANYKNATEKENLIRYYGPRLKNIIDIVETFIQQKEQMVRRGQITRNRAQNEVIQLIEQIRYNEGNGYIWLTTDQYPYPKMIMEPVLPELNGKVLKHEKFNNASGTNKNIFTVSVEVCKDSIGEHDGFINYTWHKPKSISIEPEPGMFDIQTYDTSAVEVPKFAYVRRFKEWGWIIGTGIYLDDAIKESMLKSKEDLREMKYANGKGYYWINDNTRPTPRLIMNPYLEHKEGEIITEKKYNRAWDRDYNLYEAFLDACEKTGEGFVEYKWDKPVRQNEIIEDAQKTSFVKYFKPLGWVIGSGVYIDDIETVIQKKIDTMKKERRNLIVNYLMISVTIAIISVFVLVYMMRRHFKKHHEEDDWKQKEKEKEREEASGKDEKEKQKTEEKEKPEDILDSAGKLLKIFLNEQTKLLAFNRAIEKSKESDDRDDLHELADNIKELTDQIRSNTSDIRRIIHSEDNDTSPADEKKDVGDDKK